MIHVLDVLKKHPLLKIDSLISNYPPITITAIEENVGISRGSVQNILHNELKVHKICKKWVPHVLTDENKKNRVEISKKLLIMDLIILSQVMKLGFIFILYQVKNQIKLGLKVEKIGCKLSELHKMLKKG